MVNLEFNKEIMRTLLLQLLLVLIIVTKLSAQASLSEDFEAYSNGDLITIISSDWKLWPKGTDTHVTTEKAATGTKSLKLVGGKLTDLYYPFKRRFTAGAIQFSMDLFVPEGSNGYFSFQGNELPGQVWSMECYLDKDGFFRLVEGGVKLMRNAYPQDEWFTISVDINFDNHLWRFYINDACVGSYIQDEAPRQSIASLALYPNDANSIFYVDNISFEHQGMANEILSPKYDASLVEIYDGELDNNLAIESSIAGINGTEQKLKFLLENQGTEIITNLELELETQGQSAIHSFELNLPSGSDTVVTLEDKLTYEGKQTASLLFTKINGLADESSCNNYAQIGLHGYELHPDKKVWIEEATGTWCGWCPRGEVYLKMLSEKYPDNLVLVAVHKDDPMEVVPWIGVSGSRNAEEAKGLQKHVRSFPSAFVARDSTIDPMRVEQLFLESATRAPLVLLSHSAKWDSQTRELAVTVTADLKGAVPDELKLIVGLTEDKVKGEGSKWAQKNFYANNQRGPMGGFELLPASIPGSEMVYNHVAKLLLTPFEGEVIRRDAFDPKGSTIVRTYKHRIPGEWYLENMNIVSGLIIGAQMDNANKTTIAEALGK